MDSISNPQNCAVSFTYQASIQGLPFSFNFTPNLIGDPGCFPPGTFYTWTWGNGTSTESTSPNTQNQVFPGPGKYNVCLRAQYNSVIVQFCDSITVSATANCLPDFTYSKASAPPFTYQFNRIVNPQCIQNTTYVWTWGDSTQIQSSSLSLTKTFPGPGTYEVCLRAISLGQAPTKKCYTIQVLAPIDSVLISGKILRNDVCQAKNVLVQLISLSDDSLYSTTVNGLTDSCRFVFKVPKNPLRNWIVRAKPADTLAYLRTYMGDVVFYDDAYIFSTPQTGQTSPDIHLVPKTFTIPTDSTNPLWTKITGTISGEGTLVSSMAAGNIQVNGVFHLSKAEVSFLNVQGQTVANAFVHQNGTFRSPPLPPGNYRVKIDHPKVPGQMKTVTIGAGSENHIDFEAGSTGIDIVTEVKQRVKEKEMVISPNPASNTISVSGFEGFLKITDSKGKVVIEIEAGKKISIAQLPPGLYVITGIHKSNQFLSGRFIKQ